MPGTLIFKPIEAKLTHNTDFFTKMNPYCAFTVGGKRIKGQVCKKGGKAPHWNETVTIPITDESNILIEVMDKDKITKDDHIGSFEFNLQEIESLGQIKRWFPLVYKKKSAGELQMEVIFERSDQEIIPEPEVIPSKEQLVQSEVAQEELTSVKQEGIITEHAKKVSVEQRQVVEPHTFIKEVDVVETKPHNEQIEVMESQKLMKEVEYTGIVPIKKQIETVETQVVQKEVEVIEPRVINKQIQVVENVPVTKLVEVIELVPVIKEVEAFESQTFTKQIEVTELVPVNKVVTVTEPVHVKKMVEFVEPIITTETITKEIQPEVIVNEEITKSVGPVTLLGVPEDFKESVSFRQLSRFDQESLTRYPEEEHVLGDSLRNRMQRYSVAYHNQHHQGF